LRYEKSLVLTPQAGAFVRGGQALADGTIWGSSSRLLVEFLLEHYELYAHMIQPYLPSVSWTIDNGFLEKYLSVTSSLEAYL
jgi:hypothetical protein